MAWARKVKIGEMTEVESFIQGVKRGLLVHKTALNREKRLLDYYVIKSPVNSKYVGVFKSKKDAEKFSEKNLSAQGLGEILGYPPKAYKKWGEMYYEEQDKKAIIEFYGNRFVCFVEDVDACLDWLWKELTNN